VGALTNIRKKTTTPWWAWPVLVVLLPLVVAVLALWLLCAALLPMVVWLTWCRHGLYVLVVYSSSPVWQEYFETRVLPALGDRAVVLNWSERKQWKLSLAVALFKFFGGLNSRLPIVLA
jgi:hypothetical protein